MDTSTATPDVTSLDHSSESATKELYRAAIGPINADYYLPVFLRFEASERPGRSWNWAASLNTLNWMAFRRIRGGALVYLGGLAGTGLMVSGMGRMLFQFSETTDAEIVLWVAFGIAAFVVPGLYGNALLHADSRKKMTAALTGSKTLLEACNTLTRQAASIKRFLGLGALNLALAGVATGAFMSFSSISTLMVKTLKTSEGRPLAAVIPITDLTPKPALLTASAPAPSASAMEPILPAPVASAPPSPAPASSAPAASASSIAPPIVVPAKPLKPALEPAKPAAAASAVAAVKKPAPAVARPAPAAAHPFYINVGLFSQESNATNAQAKLEAAGLNVLTQKLETAKGPTTRVRVGPFSTRKEADAAVKKIHDIKLEAVVSQK